MTHGPAAPGWTLSAGMRSALRSLLGVSAVILFAVAAPARADKLVLRVSLQLPLSHPLGQNLESFKRLVEEKSGGAVGVEIYSQGVLYADHEVVEAVTSGKVEMGVAALAILADAVPIADIFTIPFLFPTAEALARATAADGPIRVRIDRAIVKTGACPLWWLAFGKPVIVSRGAPVRRPEDLAGLSAIRARNLHQVVDHATVTGHGHIEFVCLINDAVWQALSEKYRTLITFAGRRMERRLRDRAGRQPIVGAGGPVPGSGIGA